MIDLFLDTEVTFENKCVTSPHITLLSLITVFCILQKIDAFIELLIHFSESATVGSVQELSFQPM